MEKQEFKPEKGNWNVYFNFYENTSEEIEKFKQELKELYPFILGFVKDDRYEHYRLLAYFSSKEDCDKQKNNNTLMLYNKYTSKENRKGYMVF